MTNPNNAVGTNGAYGGRTSVAALNDVLSAFTGRGIISGWSVAPSSGMTVNLGGVAGVRDVAIAEGNNGNRTTIDNIVGAPIPLTLAAAPATNSRIDAIVAYVNNPPEGSATALDNPGACGLISVSSTVASSPSVPTESAIRAAITADGASGTAAFYCVLGTVRVAAGTTTVTADMITAGTKTLPKVASPVQTLATTSETAIAANSITYWVNGAQQSQSGVTLSSLKVATNADGSAFRVFGQINLSAPTATSTGEWRFTTPLRPSTEMTVQVAGIRTNITSSYQVTTVAPITMTVAPNGIASLAGVRQADELTTIILPPTLQFTA